MKRALRWSSSVELSVELFGGASSLNPHRVRQAKGVWMQRGSHYHYPPRAWTLESGLAIIMAFVYFGSSLIWYFLCFSQSSFLRNPFKLERGELTMRSTSSWGYSILLEVPARCSTAQLCDTTRSTTDGQRFWFSFCFWSTCASSWHWVCVANFVRRPDCLSIRLFRWSTLLHIQRVHYETHCDSLTVWHTQYVVPCTTLVYSGSRARFSVQIEPVWRSDFQFFSSLFCDHHKENVLFRTEFNDPISNFFIWD